jgi:predicted esterase
VSPIDRVVLAGLLSFGLLAPAAAQGKPAAKEKPLPERTTRHELSPLPQSRYYLTQPERDVAPGRALGLLVVLPGGNGGDDFVSFVAGSLAECAPTAFLCAMLTAPKWSPDQKIVWPTAAAPEAGMQYSTEDYVHAVIEDVGKRHKIDAQKVVLLGWSSSGPALHELLASGHSPAQRAYVAMSVWKAKDAAAVAATKGMRVVLDQSRDDKVTPFPHAEQALQMLTAAGATVRLMAHKGEHGWTDAPLPRVREGLRWLLTDEPAPKPAPLPVKKGTNLVQNGGFEDGTNKWFVKDNSKRFGVRSDAERREGSKSMFVSKSGTVPVDFVRQEFDIPGPGRLTFRAWVKGEAVTNSFVKVFLYDAAGEPIDPNVDVMHLRGNVAWTRLEQTWDTTGAVKGEVQILMVAPGEVWIDGVEALWAK